MKYPRIPWGMRAMKEPGLTPALYHPDHTMLFPAEKMPERKKPPESLWAALLPCHILILPQTTFFYKQKTILNPLSPFILYGRTVLEVFVCC